MSNVEVVRDAPRPNLPPVDESIVLPAKVRAAAEKANSYYGQAPAPVQDQTPPQPAPQPAPAPVQDQTPPQPAPQPAPVPQAAAQPDVAPQPAPQPEPVAPEQWEHRYHSMKGRFDQAAQTVGAQGEQLRQMGDELVRMQELLRNVAPRQQKQPQPAPTLITDEDVKGYGPELVDTMKRAAMDAVAPQLTRLEQENQQLKQRLERGSRQTIYQTLDQQLPDWRTTNANPRFKEWLRLRDIYSGDVRQALLNKAMQAADAPRVVAFFKGFVADEQATGQQSPVPPPQQQSPAPTRQAAVPLETLAAPGRANPATGNTQVPVEKPVFTRQQVATFYDNVRRGAYVGREQQKEIEEQGYIAASREGRVR